MKHFPVRIHIHLFSVSLLTAAIALSSSIQAGTNDSSWIQLFDGENLDNWKASENPSSFGVMEGCITNDGPRSHLFYMGENNDALFENFELKLDVNATAGSNSGVYFHTKFQDEGWPEEGFEVQVNNSQKQHGNYLEMKKTGSLYGIRNIYKAMAADDEWFELHIKVQKPRVRVWVDNELVVDYVEPTLPLPENASVINQLGSGTFALQGHDPDSHAFYKNIRVRPLPSTAEPTPSAPINKTQAQILKLAKDNFPLLDLHTHLKGGLTLEHVLEISRKTGMGLGIAVNGGKGFPVQDDEAALEFLTSIKHKPVFAALQAEGREWMHMFSLKAIAQFDYVFTDSMTWTNNAGNRLRLWIPEESDIGEDPQAFMDELTEKTVEIISTEPIDIYVNPTYLPASIAADYDKLWTRERMQKIIDAAVAHNVAIEINGRFRLPSEAFLKMAKQSGAKFTFGTNNGGADDFGSWEYPLEMQQRLDLSWKDMFVPGHAPSRSQRVLASGIQE